MEKIRLKEFAELLEQNDDLRQQLRSCPDAETALAEMNRLAEAQGYELDETPVPLEALPDDALASVAGGFEPAALDVNPYSWFVTLFRRLIQDKKER
ncbi:MAG: Nif11-like leader peptide family natural product precursor [Oscillospiraceae bacterium]|nr:Nif11-like leader peptide family natural product precursor [Oscillospiraceae bacterium]